MTFTLPENVTRIAISFSDTPAVLPVDTLSQLLKSPAPLNGQKLQIINKDFTNWAYRNYSMQGNKWLIKAKYTVVAQKYSVYLPLSC
jgi:hypothetical protein